MYISEEERKDRIERLIKIIDYSAKDTAFPLVGDKKIADLIRGLDNTEDILTAIVSSNDWDVKYSPNYAEASKLCSDNMHWYRCRGILGENCRKTDSDVGALKIGNENFSIRIPNGEGDGTTRYAILKKGTDENKYFNDRMFNYVCAIQGKFNIYAYDCGDWVDLADVEGTFSVYYFEGLIALKEY